MSHLCDMPTDFKITKVKRDSTQGRQEPHIHPYYEIFYLINGDCTFFIGHNIYQLNQGDLVVVPKGEIHKSTYPQIGSSQRFVVCFKESHVDWVCQLLERSTVESALTSGVISIPQGRRAYIESLMTQLIAESEGQDALSPAFVRTQLLELTLFLIRCRLFGQSSVKEIDVDNQLIQEVATYIYQNYQSRLDLQEIADRFHISRSYLSRKFKAVTGFGFKEYILNLRIKNACRLLLQTKKSITDIAFECGFNDSNYFGDAFRRIKGISPYKYRKNQEMV